MKKILAALASATLMTAPLVSLPTPALAQHHGGGGGGWHGGGGGGGWHGGGGWGGGYHGGGWGGYRGYRGGYYGWGGYPYFWGGLALGYYAADPWYYDYPAYYGYAPYYGGGYSYDSTGPADGDYEEGPPPSSADRAPPAYNPPSGVHAGQGPQSQSPQACGQWVWDAGANKYNWVGC